MILLLSLFLCINHDQVLNSSMDLLLLACDWLTKHEKERMKRRRDNEINLRIPVVPMSELDNKDIFHTHLHLSQKLHFTLSFILYEKTL